MTKLLYLCDRMASCGTSPNICSMECSHTTDIKHSVNYKNNPPKPSDIYSKFERLNDEILVEKDDEPHMSYFNYISNYPRINRMIDEKEN